MKTCQSCKMEVADDKTVCPVCGSKSFVSSDPVSSGPTDKTADESPEEISNKGAGVPPKRPVKSNAKARGLDLRLVGVIAAILVGVIVVAVFGFGGDQESAAGTWRNNVLLLNLEEGGVARMQSQLGTLVASWRQDGSAVTIVGQYQGATLVTQCELAGTQLACIEPNGLQYTLTR